MGLITAIVANPKNPGRFDVLVDGRGAGAISIEGVERLKLSVGTPFEPVRSAFAVEVALLATWDRAVKMLALRARSRAELRRELTRKGEVPALVEGVLVRLERAGYVDDAAFAQQFARSRAFGAGMSRRRVQRELAERGVARDVAEAAVQLAFAEEGVNEREVVQRVAQKKLRSLARVDPMTRRRRLYAFLARRGFDSDVIARILEELDATLGDGGATA